MRMIQIDDTKVDKMSTMVEDALSTLGRLMSCIEEMGEESAYGERHYDDGMRYGRYGERRGRRY